MDVAKEHMKLFAAREEGAADRVRWRQMIGSEGREGRKGAESSPKGRKKENRERSKIPND